MPAAVRRSCAGSVPSPRALALRFEPPDAACPRRPSLSLSRFLPILPEDGARRAPLSLPPCRVPATAARLRARLGHGKGRRAPAPCSRAMGSSCKCRGEVSLGPPGPLLAARACGSCPTWAHGRAPRTVPHPGSHFFFVYVLRPSNEIWPMAEPCKALPHTQSATWAWAEKAPARLGRIEPATAPADLSHSDQSNGQECFSLV